ncbi:MAG TPA: shikimate dehydrogenase, partial [Fimbriimonadaceae bacterium]|nr:shikimate dehydrogenase [Fimbriimonadaceae bacterium]
LELPRPKILRVSDGELSAVDWQNAPKAEFGVIGDPVSHSRSPKMHEAAYRSLGLPYSYLAIHVPVGEVEPALDHLKAIGYRGLNVTVPNKVSALQWSTKPDAVATRIGAANTLDLTSGRCTNTDGSGFLDTLSDLNLPSGARVHILGSGGSARALAATLPAAGYDVAIWNRTRTSAEKLKEEFPLSEVLETPSLDCDLLVNTTSAGLTGDRLPIDWSGANNLIAYDLVYGSTPFLEEADRHGLQTVDGKGLLVAQGARSFYWWLGFDPPRQVMLEAIQ